MKHLLYNLSKYAKISKFERAKDILRNNSRIFPRRIFLMKGDGGSLVVMGDIEEDSGRR
jgi:hypothetical protein